VVGAGVALGTVPGTVREVVRKATFRANCAAVLGLVFGATAAAVLPVIPAETRKPIPKASRLVIGEAILAAAWKVTREGTRSAASTAVWNVVPSAIWTAACVAVREARTGLPETGRGGGRRPTGMRRGSAV